MDLAKRVFILIASFAGFFILQLVTGILVLPAILQGSYSGNFFYLFICILVPALTATLPGLLVSRRRAKLHRRLSYVAAGYLLSAMAIGAGSKPVGAALLCIAVYAAFLVTGFTLGLMHRKTLAPQSGPTPSAQP